MGKGLGRGFRIVVLRAIGHGAVAQGDHMVYGLAMIRARGNLSRLVTSVLCALALVLLAFAHRPVAVDTRLSDPQIATYLALGGSLADLCGSGKGGEDGANTSDCPACLLVKSIAPAPASDGPAAPAGMTMAEAVWAGAPAPAGQSPRAPPARAPPVLLLI